MLVTYTGTDGSSWDLRQIAQDGRSVFLTDGGLQGLGSPDFDFFTQSGPITPGQRLTGYRTKERKVYLPVLIGVNLPEDQFLELSRRWWRANAPGEYGTLTVTTGDGLSRSIRIRFQDDGGKAYDNDPTDEGSDLYGLTYIADFPLWLSPLVRSTYTADAGQDFYNSGSYVAHAWTGTPNLSTSTETAMGVLRTNLVPNPNFEGGSTYGFGADTGAPTLSVTQTVKMFGTSALQATSTTASGDVAVNLSVPVPADGTYRFSYYVYSPVACSSYFDTETANVVGLVAVPANTWTRVSGTVTLAAGTRAFYPHNTRSSTAAGQTMYFDGFLLEAGSALGAYFDGSSPSSGGAPPFIISSSNRVVDATITNAGDVPAWGIYTFRGPFDSWNIRVNGGNVGPYPIAAGETLVLNTNPDVQSAILTRANGTVVDVTADLPSIDWRPIPRGTSVPLQIAFTGTGSIDVDLPALYYRGF